MKRITPQRAVFMMIDIQEKFVGKIQELNNVIKKANMLNRAAEILDIPLIVTEQYPKGLGNTCSEIYLPTNVLKYEKTLFSALTQEIKTKIYDLSKDWVILYGIESHVCLTQTALDAIDSHYNVMYVVDGVASRNDDDKKIALMRLQSAGVIMVTTEMLLFELVKDAKHPNFKEISQLVK